MVRRPKLIVSASSGLSMGWEKASRGEMAPFQPRCGVWCLYMGIPPPGTLAMVLCASALGVVQVASQATNKRAHPGRSRPSHSGVTTRSSVRRAWYTTWPTWLNTAKRNRLGRASA